MGVRARLGPLLASSGTARPQTAAVLLGGAGALVAFVGSFMPWAISGDEIVSGTSQYGAATLALSLVGAAVLGAPYLKGMEGVPFRLAALGAVLCGVLAAVAVSYDISDISRVVRLRGEHLGASPAFGLYVTLAGGVLLALGSLATALARPRPLPFERHRARTRV